MPRAVVRAMQILENLGPSDKGLTHAQITKSLCVPKSSVSSILRDLVSLEFISFDSSTKKYALGSKIISLAYNYLVGLDLNKIGGPIVHDLARITGESVAIYIQSGTECQLVNKEDSPQPVLMMLNVGARAPMHAIAAGKVLLAYLPEKEIRTYLSSIKLKSYTRYTITDRKKFIKELQRIRKEAVAYNREEFEEGVIGVAAPVRDLTKNVVAALTVVAPSFRFGKERRLFFEKALKEKAAYFSKMLGFQKN